MPAPIYIPRRQNPWTNMMPGLLQNLVLQKIGQNMRLKEKEMEIKQKTEEAKVGMRKSGYTELEAQKPSDKAIKAYGSVWERPKFSVGESGVPGIVEQRMNDEAMGFMNAPKGQAPEKLPTVKLRDGVYTLKRDSNNNIVLGDKLGDLPPSGTSTSLSVGPEGGVNFYSGPDAQVTPMNPTKTTQNKIQDDIITLDDTINVMGDAIKASDPKFQELGTIFSNVLTGWKAKSKGVPVLSDILGTVSPEEASALSAFADYRNKWANSIIPRMRKMAGSNFTKNEQKMYYQMLPKTGTGIFDGDDPITFQKKAKNAYEMNLKERARRKFYMSSGKSYDDYKKAVASGKIMSLDETMEMINRKGAEVEAQLRASGKGLSDEQIAMQVKTILKNLYGN
jgi:hypothetical protein